MSAGTALETVIIYTRDMHRLARWYETQLELEPFVAAPGHLGQRVGSVYLGFDEVEEPATAWPGAVHTWFTVDDLDVTFERMVTAGAPVRFAPTEKPWGARLAAVHDPDGNVVGLSQRR